MGPQGEPGLDGAPLIHGKPGAAKRKLDVTIHPVPRIAHQKAPLGWRSGDSLG